MRRAAVELQEPADVTDLTAQKRASSEVRPSNTGETKKAEIAAQTTIGEEIPGIALVNQGVRFDGAGTAFTGEIGIGKFEEQRAIHCPLHRLYRVLRRRRRPPGSYIDNEGWLARQASHLVVFW
jgi:hypothetical protein